MKVRVWRNMRADTVEVFVSPEPGRVIRWNTVNSPAGPPEIELGADETLKMTEDMARALYDELKIFFGESGDYSQLRKDFLHERSRVDKFIERLLQ